MSSFDAKQADALAAAYSEQTGATVTWVWSEATNEIRIVFTRLGEYRHGIRATIRPQDTLESLFREALDCWTDWEANHLSETDT